MSISTMIENCYAIAVISTMIEVIDVSEVTDLKSFMTYVEPFIDSLSGLSYGVTLLNTLRASIRAKLHHHFESPLMSKFYNVFSPLQLNPLLILPAFINPAQFPLIQYARFFVIKCKSVEQARHSINFHIWYPDEASGAQLNKTFIESTRTFPLYLFFALLKPTGVYQFCGMAEMTSPLYMYHTGEKDIHYFYATWIFVKDVPNMMLNGIRFSYEAIVKPDRNLQEISFPLGKQMLNVMHNYVHSSSLL